MTRGIEIRVLDGVNTRRMGTTYGIYPWVVTLVLGNLMGSRFWVGCGCGRSSPSSLRISWSCLDLLSVTDPSNPIFTGTVGILHLPEVLSMTPVHYPYIIFLYSILIPQHPVQGHRTGPHVWLCGQFTDNTGEKKVKNIFCPFSSLFPPPCPRQRSPQSKTIFFIKKNPTCPEK
jgi:hypothetical protein